jgi:methylase of polypeptide subunit release factors
LICANLPYIPTGKLSAVNSRAYEPSEALDGGADGLRLLRRLFEQIPQHVCPRGCYWPRRKQAWDRQRLPSRGKPAGRAN